MSQPADDAQRKMEQHALRNVRGLLDKMEGQELAERWSVRKFAVTLGIVIVVFAVAIALLVNFVKKPGQTKSITLPPPPASAPK